MKNQGRKICICVPRRFDSEIEIEATKVNPTKLHNCPMMGEAWSTGRHSPRKTVERFLDFAIAMGWTNLAHLGWYFMTKDFGGKLEKKPV